MTAAPACSEARVVALGARRYHVDVAPFSGEDLSRAFVSDVAIHPTLGVALIMRGDPVVRWYGDDGQGRGHWQYDATPHGHSACFDLQGRLHLVDSDRHCVHRFDTDGALDITLGIADEPRWREPFNHPTGVAVASSGEIWVSDGYGNSHVHQFSSQGRHLRSWGGIGGERGRFSNPHAIAIDAEDRVWVVDRENHRVQCLSVDGEWCGEIDGLHLPTAIAIGHDGILYVSDQTPRLCAYTPSGQLIGRCRTFGAIGHGLAVDARGDIYVANMMPNCVTRLRRFA